MDKWEYAIKYRSDFSRKIPNGQGRKLWGAEKDLAFDYKFDPEMLNEFGRQGWELVAVDGDGSQYYFKRKIN